MSELHRPYLRSNTKEAVLKNAQHTQTNAQGQIVDPNTGQVLDGTAQYGHVPGMENRGFVSYATQSGMTQEELNNTTNNAGLYQLESPEGNMSHQYEETDANETALNTANYCYMENPQYQASTFVNPPSAEGEPWTVTTVNTQTGDVSTVGTFTPDLGEVTAESQAAIASAAPSYSSAADGLSDSSAAGGISGNNDTDGISDNDMGDFGGSDSPADSGGISDSDGNDDGMDDGDDDGMGM